MRSGFAILCALSVLPIAVAGTELAPDVDDSPDQEDPRLDLLAAWFENEPSGVRFTVKIAAVESNASDMFYWVRFDSGGAERIAAVVLGANGETLTYLGPSGPGSDGEPPEAIANGALDHVDLKPGEPGYATAILPRADVGGLFPGARLENLSAGVSQYQRTRAFWADVDARRTENVFVIEHTVIPSVISTNALIIAALVIVFAAGAGAGVWVGLRRARQGGRDEAPRDAPEDAQAKPRFGLHPKR